MLTLGSRWFILNVFISVTIVHCPTAVKSNWEMTAIKLSLDWFYVHMSDHRDYVHVNIVCVFTYQLHHWHCVMRSVICNRLCNLELLARLLLSYTINPMEKVANCFRRNFRVSVLSGRYRDGPL